MAKTILKETEEVVNVDKIVSWVESTVVYYWVKNSGQGQVGGGAGGIQSTNKICSPSITCDQLPTGQDDPQRNGRSRERWQNCLLGRQHRCLLLGQEQWSRSSWWWGGQNPIHKQNLQSKHYLWSVANWPRQSSKKRKKLWMLTK